MSACPKCGSKHPEARLITAAGSNPPQLVLCDSAWHDQQDVEGGEEAVTGRPDNSGGSSAPPSTTSQHIAIVHNALWHAKQAGRVSVGPALASLDALERELAGAENQLEEATMHWNDAVTEYADMLEQHRSLQAENKRLERELAQLRENRIMREKLFQGETP